MARLTDPGRAGTGVRTRRLSRFTQQRGDEAAAELAAKFAKIVREVVLGRAPLRNRLLDSGVGRVWTHAEPSRSP